MPDYDGYGDEVYGIIPKRRNDLLREALWGKQADRTVAWEDLVGGQTSDEAFDMGYVYVVELVNRSTGRTDEVRVFWEAPKAQAYCNEAAGAESSYYTRTTHREVE